MIPKTQVFPAEFLGRVGKGQVLQGAFLCLMRPWIKGGGGKGSAETAVCTGFKGSAPAPCWAVCELSDSSLGPNRYVNADWADTQGSSVLGNFTVSKDKEELKVIFKHWSDQNTENK